ncbi:MAG: XdhC/CoxI family protein [Sorangiineae bacterium]|nr:XdhC/CoxI family protein [Polyangiaceae bacterium]MEB2323852.1 XdhC/CoxI family protein [Sorangiineae bacterium]
MRAVFEALLAELDAGRPAVLATVVATQGSAPQVVGARLLYRADGTIVGTVGGGRIEALVLERAAAVLGSRESELVKRHLVHELGMCCGGAMEILVEPIEERPRLVLMGAGHVAQATARLAAGVGFDVTVVDAREELNDEAHFAGAAHVLAEPAEAVRRGLIAFTPGTYVVIATHEHRLDEEALAACLDVPRRYLGMIGSRRKVLRIFQRILARRPEAPLDEVRAPIGLDLGGRTPEEIALAIAGELVSVRRGGTAAALARGAARPARETDAPRADDHVD